MYDGMDLFENSRRYRVVVFRNYRENGAVPF
jgi:hypothetical protein